MPKKASVSTGWRWASRALLAADRRATDLGGPAPVRSRRAVGLRAPARSQGAAAAAMNATVMV
jgi:hypothetical protein